MDQKQIVTVPPLSQEVYLRLRENIMNGYFLAGEKISIRRGIFINIYRL